MADVFGYQSYILSVVSVSPLSDRTLSVMISSGTYTYHMLCLLSHYKRIRKQTLNAMSYSNRKGGDISRYLDNINIVTFHPAIRT